MFIGHYALGYAAKKVDALPSLAMMFVAVQFLDLLWPLFVLAGLETFTIEPGITAMTPLNFTYYPYSHSLLMAVVWGAVLAAFYFGFTRNRKGALLLGLLVVSHWVLDFLTHRPDLPLAPFGDARVGLGLWNYPAVETAVETILFVVGVAIYYRTMKPKRKLAFWLLVLFFLAIHFMNVFGPPPPSVNAVAWSANLMWLFVVWAWFIERKTNRREIKSANRFAV